MIGKIVVDRMCVDPFVIAECVKGSSASGLSYLQPSELLVTVVSSLEIATCFWCPRSISPSLLNLYTPVLIYLQ